MIIDWLNNIFPQIPWANIEWGYPDMFYLLPLPLLIVLLPARKNKNEALYFPAVENASKSISKRMQKNNSQSSKGFFGYTFLIASWFFAIVALAGPQLVGEPEKKVKSSRDFLIVSDISISMDTNDWESKEGDMVSRWDGVREVLAEFIEKREGDRMGLMVFGAQPFLQAPFTTDLGTVTSLLDETEVGMAGNRTVIYNSIAYASKIFQVDSIDQKVMLLLTDGQDSGSEILPDQAIRMAKDDDIKIYTLGIGDPNATMYDLDEDLLTEIAEETGGSYFNASDPESLTEVYNTLNELEPIEYEDDSYIPKRLLFYYPLGVSLAIIMSLLILRSLVAIGRIIINRFI